MAAAQRIIRRMRNASSDRQAQGYWLGIEGGGTRTRVLAVTTDGQVLARRELGPANLHLMTDRELLQRLRSVRAVAPAPLAVGLGLAGARTAADRERVRRAVAQVWPAVPCRVTHDLEIALRASTASGVESRASREPSVPSSPRVLVLSGTGSCCFGLGVDGRSAKVGGWGHVLGDRGSGYDVAWGGLREVLRVFDRSGQWPRLGQRLLRAGQLNSPEELIDWAQGAGKAEIAALAPEVLRAAQAGDALARRICQQKADELVTDAACCARRVGSSRERVVFVLAGGVLEGPSYMTGCVRQRLRRARPGSRIEGLSRDGVWGAVALAREAWDQAKSAARLPVEDLPVSGGGVGAATSETAPSLAVLALSPTERRNPRSRRLDRMPTEAAVRLMLSEDEQIPEAVWKEHKKIVRAIGWIARAFRQGGRLVYAGAGTSGRLGVLDASECPPTFQTEPELVQGVIAGGQRALWESVEGAEDDPGAGAEAMLGRGVGRNDVVVGIAASGRTPFVWGALDEARRRGAATVLLTFNPHLQVPQQGRPHLVIAIDVGPEVLTGSTRLKAGTATKLVLNLFTTLAMVRCGKVMSNLMVDVKASNSKLRDRAERILRELTGARRDACRSALEEARWNIRAAAARVRRHI